MGQAFSFDGVDDYVNVGAAYNGVQSVAFWMRAATSTTGQMLALNGSVNIEITGDTVTANGFTAPAIYVDGVSASTISDTAWHHIAVTTGTALNASAMTLGLVGATYFGGTLDDVRTYGRVLSAEEIKRLYTIGR